MAFHAADCDQALRASIHAGPRPHRNYEVGQAVFFWRRGAGSTKKTRTSYWQGPARVMMTYLPGCLWLSFQNTVVKVAPERVTQAYQQVNLFTSQSKLIEHLVILNSSVNLKKLRSHPANATEWNSLRPTVFSYRLRCVKGNGRRLQPKTSSDPMRPDYNRLPRRRLTIVTPRRSRPQPRLRAPLRRAVEILLYLWHRFWLLCGGPQDSSISRRAFIQEMPSSENSTAFNQEKGFQELIPASS